MRSSHAISTVFMFSQYVIEIKWLQTEEAEEHSLIFYRLDRCRCKYVKRPKQPSMPTASNLITCCWYGTGKFITFSLYILKSNLRLRSDGWPPGDGLGLAISIQQKRELTDSVSDHPPSPKKLRARTNIWSCSRFRQQHCVALMKRKDTDNLTATGVLFKLSERDLRRNSKVQRKS